MTWIALMIIVLAIAFIVMAAKRAEEPETRHAEPGQGKPPEVKEREERAGGRAEVYET